MLEIYNLQFEIFKQFLIFQFFNDDEILLKISFNS